MRRVVAGRQPVEPRLAALARRHGARLAIRTRDRDGGTRNRQVGRVPDHQAQRARPRLRRKRRGETQGQRAENKKSHSAGGENAVSR